MSGTLQLGRPPRPWLWSGLLRLEYSTQVLFERREKFVATQRSGLRQVLPRISALEVPGSRAPPLVKSPARSPARPRRARGSPSRERRAARAIPESPLLCRWRDRGSCESRQRGDAWGTGQGSWSGTAMTIRIPFTRGKRQVVQGARSPRSASLGSIESRSSKSGAKALSNCAILNFLLIPRLSCARA